MENIRILTVAPYPEFCSLARKAATAIPDIQQEIFLGNLNDAIAYTQVFPRQEFDIILSRGGTAELLRHSCSIPVVEAKISPYDFLCAIQTAQSCGEPFAITGYASVLLQAQTLCGILHLNDIPICEVRSDNTSEVIESLRARGIRCIVGDVISVETAARAGMRGILIASSEQSISESLADIVAIFHYSANEAKKRRLFQSTADLSVWGIVLLDAQGDLYYANAVARGLGLVELHQYLREQISRFAQNPSIHVIKKLSFGTLDIQGCILASGDEPHYIFYLQTVRRSMFASQIIMIQDREEYAAQMQMLFSTNTYIRPIAGELDALRDGCLPFLLAGEMGTEKESIARYFHMNSEFCDNPFICIRCEFLQERHWENFVSPAGSPIHDAGCTLFFEDVHKMDPWVQQVVLAYLRNTKAQLRHQIIFSSGTDIMSLMLEGRFPKDLYHSVCNRVVSVPPLRERKTDLPALAMLYLLHYNASMGKRIVGFEPQAIELLTQQDWPLNLTQFSTIIFQLARQCLGFYITAADVSGALCQLEPYAAADSKLILDLHKPLEEIERDIIRTVLEDEQQNQTAAAKRLGISRSTLWRKLQE